MMNDGYVGRNIPEGAAADEEEIFAPFGPSQETEDRLHEMMAQGAGDSSDESILVAVRADNLFSHAGYLHGCIPSEEAPNEISGLRGMNPNRRMKRGCINQGNPQADNEEQTHAETIASPNEENSDCNDVRALSGPIKAPGEDGKAASGEEEQAGYDDDGFWVLPTMEEMAKNIPSLYAEKESKEEDGDKHAVDRLSSAMSFSTTVSGTAHLLPGSCNEECESHAVLEKMARLRRGMDEMRSCFVETSPVRKVVETRPSTLRPLISNMEEHLDLKVSVAQQRKRIMNQLQKEGKQETIIAPKPVDEDLHMKPSAIGDAGENDGRGAKKDNSMKAAPAPAPALKDSIQANDDVAVMPGQEFAGVKSPSPLDKKGTTMVALACNGFGENGIYRPLIKIQARLWNILSREEMEMAALAMVESVTDTQASLKKAAMKIAKNEEQADSIIKMHWEKMGLAEVTQQYAVDTIMKMFEKEFHAQQKAQDPGSNPTAGAERGACISSNSSSTSDFTMMDSVASSNTLTSFSLLSLGLHQSFGPSRSIAGSEHDGSKAESFEILAFDPDDGKEQSKSEDK